MQVDDTTANSDGTLLARLEMSTGMPPTLVIESVCGALTVPTG